MVDIQINWISTDFWLEIVMNTFGSILLPCNIKFQRFKKTASKNSKDDLTWKQLMQSIAPASGKRTAAVSSSTSSPTWASSSSMPSILFYCFLLNIYLLYLYDHLTHEYKTMCLSHCEKVFFSVWNFCILFEHRLNACLEVLNVKMWQNARNFTQKRAPWTFSTTGHLWK